MIAVALGLVACTRPPPRAAGPAELRLDRAVDTLWADEIRRVARDGDWLLTRSFSAGGDLIAGLSPGEDVSHASIVDVTRGTVIEAITPVVREIPLEALLSRNRHVLVVRPAGVDAAASARAVERARSQLGAPFDLWGLVGYPQEDRWYCSELAYWASGLQDRLGPRTVLFPSRLVELGEVLYYSGRRDDPQVRAIAAGRLARAATVAAAPSVGRAGRLDIEP